MTSNNSGGIIIQLTALTLQCRITYNVPSTEPTRNRFRAQESDYSDKVDENFKGLALESKPRPDTNKEYTAEYAFNRCRIP